MPPTLNFVSEAFKKKIDAEYAQAKAFFSSASPLAKNGLKQKFEFKCYRHDLIKQTLVQLFKGKCAYCDSALVHITAGDIEHFRPKSVYWWLATDWDNLLFACEKCNRTGKNDAFPLLDGNITECRHDSPPTVLAREELELRLLINPCKENPEHFFSYDEKTASIYPLPSHPKGTRPRLMAENSITIYQLQRRELVQEREKVLLLLLAQIEETKKNMEDYNRMAFYPATIREHFENRMRKSISKLLLHANPERQYLGMVRQVLRKFFLENKLRLPSLLQ